MAIQTSKRSLRNNKKGDSFPSKQTFLVKTLQASVGVMTAATLLIPTLSIAADTEITGNDLDPIGQIIWGGDGSDSRYVEGESVYYIYGQYSNNIDLNASGSNVTINDGSIIRRGSSDGNVAGGWVNGTGNANNNIVTVNGGSIAADVVGGVVKDGIGSTENNIVFINGGTIGRDVVAGMIDGSDGHAIGNTVIINAGSISGDVVGGGIYYDDQSSRSSANGYANNNTVYLTENFTGEVLEIFGGYIDESSTGSAIGNAVIVDNGTIYSVIGGVSFNTTGNAEDTISGNKVTINGGEVTSSATGGYTAGLAAVSGNKVIINGGTVNSARGGYGSSSSTGDITGNIVTINGGNVVNIYGGRVGTTTAEGKGSVIANEVYLNGGIITGDIYAGYGINGTVTGNAIYIDGNSSDKVEELNIKDATLYGSSNAATGEYGNTLNIKNYIGGTAKNIVNFDAVNVDLTGLDLNQVGDGSGAILTLTDSSTDLSNSTITVSSTTNIGGLSGVAETSTSLAEKYTIIANSNGSLSATDEKITNKITVVQDGSLYSNYTLIEDHSDGTISYAIGEIDTVPGTGIFNEHRLATLAFLNEAADFVLDRKLQCSVREDGSVPETCFYGAVSGGDLHHDLNGSGNWAHTRGTHLFIGVRGKMNDKQDTSKDINTALWVEAGWGNVDTHNNWANGSGDTHYYGLGVLAEYRQKEGSLKGSYAQVHAKVGKAFGDMHSSLKSHGERMGYDENMTYYGAGLDLGYEWTLNANYMLDTSLKYRWLHLEGFDSNIGGADYKFDDIDSHRTKLGTRLNYTESKTSMPYIGIAWEHEFAGNARGSVLGYNLEGSSLKGDSGVLELGAKFKPSEKSPWNIDFSLEGYMGQREGIMGNLTVNYLF